MKKKILLGATVALLNFSPLANAGDDDTPTDSRNDKPIHGDWNHANFRNIAFGSVIMGANGSDVTSWKAVDTFNFCLEPIPEGPKPPDTIPDPPTSDDPTGNDDEDTSTGRGNGDDEEDGDDDTDIGTGTECLREVLYTTHYELIECPDGRAYIGRSGEGVTLTSNTEGSLFLWAEVRSCGGLELPEPIPTDGMSKTRPLIHSKLIKN